MGRNLEEMGNGKWKAGNKRGQKSARAISHFPFLFFATFASHAY
jgi:hypothetical protein